MTLLLIITSLVTFSLISCCFPKYKNFFIFISVSIVISFYLFLSMNFYHTESFLPSKNLQTYHMCFNYYNLLMDSIKNRHLFIAKYQSNVDYKTDFLSIGEHDIKINNNKKTIYFTLLDTSFYKKHIYLYFGITPVLLFYLPFNLITNLYLTDKILLFILACFIFLFSLFLIKRILESITNIKNIPPNVIILSIFTVGFCNLLPFVMIRTSIYEVAITTAAFLLLISLCLFHYYVNTINTIIEYIFVFFISLFLCLAVGARPHYIFSILVVLFSIIYLKYKKNINIKNIFKTTLIFLIPCFIYGTILALYNYLRFDSIFKFGFKYQINPYEVINIKINIMTLFQDFIATAKQTLFKLPDIDSSTVFSLNKASGHSLGNDLITGICWTCPIILILLFFPKFLIQLYKKNISTFVFILSIAIIILICFIFTSFFGILIRYVFEYLFLIIILSFVVFLFYLNETKNKVLKYYTATLFTIMFIYMAFINISLLFCKENSLCIDSSSINYVKLIKFLF